MKPKIKAIIFDADGVIFDSEKLWDSGDAEFMTKRGIGKITNQIKAQLAGTSLLDGTSLLLNSYGINEEVEKAAQERLMIMEKKYSTEIEYMKGFKPFLNFVKERNLKTAVATSMSSNLFPILDDKMNFLQLFDGNVFSVSEVENAKPAPDIYLYAAKKIAADPSDCLVIEDAPNGIKAAKAAGMSCIGFATTFSPEFLTDADWVAHSFSEISDFIEKK